jgi:hypothetical protein
MKINKLQNGDMVIVFTKNEIEQINAEIKIDHTERFKCLHEKSRKFVESLYNYYGTKEFKLNDKKALEFRQKFFITDASQLMRQLKERNIVDLQYKNGENVHRKRISSINFKSL